MIVGIDPGLKGHAYAVGDATGTILQAGFVPGGLGRGGAAWVPLAKGLLEALTPLRGSVTRCVVEVPQVYTNLPGDPADLIELAGAAGAVCLALHWLDVPAGSITTVLPKTWKGQVPKDVHHRRIIEALTEQEKQRIHGKALRDQLDAVGLVKYAAKGGR